MKIELYTDGAASNNGKSNAIAGWSYALVIDDKLSHYSAGKIEGGTNNQGELMGIIEGLKFVRDNANNPYMPIKVISDSSYCIKGITEWIHGWISKDWHRDKARKEPVKNKEYWQELYNLSMNLNIEWKWVKGHAGNKWNEYVDNLAQTARQ